jgi:hypothetical protein
VIAVSARYAFHAIAQVPPSLSDWKITYANFYNSAWNAATAIIAPYDTMIYDNAWMAETAYGFQMQGWDGKQEVFRSFNDVSFSLELLVIHEYQHHLNPTQSERDVMIQTSQIASQVFGYNPWQ